MKSFLWVVLVLTQALLMAEDYCKPYQADDFRPVRKELDPLAFKGDVKAQNILGTES